MKPRLDAIRAERHGDEHGRPPLWIAVTLALLLSGAAVFGVLRMSASLEQNRDAATMARNLNVFVNSVHDTNAATTGPTPGSELQAAIAIVQLEPAVNALKEIDGGKATSDLIAAFGQLRQAIADGEQGMLTGQMDAVQVEASAAASNRVVIDAAAVSQQWTARSAVNAERWFKISTLAIFAIIAVALSSLILMWYTQRKNTSSERARQENRFRSMLQLSGEVISLVDRNGIVQAQSSSMLRLLGRSDVWLNGRAFADIVNQVERPRLGELIQRAIEHPGEAVNNRLRLSHGDGSWRSFDVTAVNLLNQPDLEGVLLTCRILDNAAPVAPVANQNQSVLVQHPVSGLLSEPFFRDRLQHALVRTSRNADPLSLLVIELGPKEAIAALSDDARAAVLRTISGRLVRSIRSEDSAAHLDDMELAIILEDADIDRARSVAERISDQIQIPVSHLNGQLKLSSNIGIAAKSDPRDSVETLLLGARTSLRRDSSAQSQNATPVEPKQVDTVVSVVPMNGTLPKPDSIAELAVPTDDMAERLVAAPRIEIPVELPQTQQLHGRLFDSSEFDLQYEPVLALQTGEIVEIEAVARWRQPHRGLVPIEASGVAEVVTLWLLERACRVAQALPPTRSGHRVRLSLNVSTATPLNESFVDSVAKVLLTTGIDPAGIQLEIPARMLEEEDPSYETTIAVMRQLRELGIRLAIDGTGAAIDRLPDLTRIPVNALKIDRSVVLLLDRSADRRALVRQIVERAQPLGVSVTGTGVETLEQAERLWDLGADQGQGALFFRSVSEEQLHALFTTESAMVAAD